MFVADNRITSSVDNDEILFFLGFGTVSIAGTGFSAFNRADFPSLEPHAGLLDEVNVWARAILKRDLRKSPIYRNFSSDRRNTQHLQGIQHDERNGGSTF